MINIVEHITRILEKNIGWWNSSPKVAKIARLKTDCDLEDDIESYGDRPLEIINQGQGQPKKSKESSVKTAEAGPTQTDSTQRELGERKFPTRQKGSRILKGVPVLRSVTMTKV